MLSLPFRAKIAEEKKEKEKKGDFRRMERKPPPPFTASFQERRPTSRIGLQSLTQSGSVLPSPPLEVEKARAEAQIRPSKIQGYVETHELSSSSADCEASVEDSGRERLKRHRVAMSGRVWIPDMWGQEELLKDWIDCAAFDAALFPSDIGSARAALVEEGRKANSGRLTIENRC